MTQLQYLAAVHSLPFCTSNGRVVQRAGHDKETGIYAHLPFDRTFTIPAKPTADQLRSALVTLMTPLRAYRWTSPDDAAAAVCAVLTAVARPMLDIAPAVLVDAAAQGSGKTKLATALGSLLTGRREGVLPFAGIDDDELRKQLIAGVLSGQSFVCIDNVTGFFRSAALAAVLTSGRLQGRVLGASRIVDAAIRPLIVVSGNNCALDADLSRRMMRVRIDAGADPTLRQFVFDPVNEALAHRLRIAEAACLIWRGYFAAGAPRIAGDDAGGFVEWSKLCRQPVLWLEREGLTDQLGWQLGDPAAAMLADPSSSDPEIEAHGELLHMLSALTDGDDFTSADLLKWFRIGEHDEDDGAAARLRSVVCELLNLRPGGEPSVRSLGRMLTNRRDRHVNGLRLMARGDKSANAKRWRVVPS